MGPLIDEDLAHLGIPAAYTWHIPITEWNALMKALHGNGVSKGKQKRATGKKAHEQAHFATLNVCGGGLESIEGAMEEIRELRERGSAPIRNTGREATKKLAEIIRYIKEGGVWLATLADTHLGEKEMREVIEYLETMGIEACGTPAYNDPASRALKAGVLIVWDPDHLQAKRDGKGEVAMEEVVRGRVVKVEMEDAASGLEWTQIGVYMPVRGRAKITVAASGGTDDTETKDPAQDAWESLRDELDKIDGEYMIGGDFNAETEAFLRSRGKKERTLSDKMFNSMLTEVGRDLRAMANDATYRAGTQIDNWIVTPALANVMGRVHIMPGVCGKDHEIVAVEYYGADDPEGEREYRPKGVSRKLDRDAEEAFTKTVQEAYDGAMQPRQGETPAERLKAMTQALTDHAKAVIKEAQDKLRLEKEGDKGGQTGEADEEGEDQGGDGQRETQRRGRPPMSQRERLRWKIAKWRRITHAVRKWSGTLKTAYTRKWGGKGFWTQECLSSLLQKIDTPDLSNSDRRKALLEECETQIGKATSEFLDCEVERGQKLTEKMEEVVVELHGNVHIAVFDIVHTESGRKARGGELRAMYVEGEEEVTCPRTKQKVKKRKVVRGGAIRKAAAERGREINKRREVDMKAVEKLLELTQPETGGQPTSSEGTERLKEEVLTWAACEKAIRRFKKGKAVGSDLLDGYLLRIATEDIQRDYWRLLVEIVETEAYPREWNDWIAMLAMKPGEDPKELERRRDLWVQPQSLKGLMRMLLPEYDRACARVVPGSQCGFTAGKNAPAQTLTARLHAEECMIERKMCVRGYIDLGTYFMV